MAEENQVWAAITAYRNHLVRVFSDRQLKCEELVAMKAVEFVKHGLEADRVAAVTYMAEAKQWEDAKKEVTAYRHP